MKFLVSVFIFIIFLSCNYSYKMTTGNEKNSLDPVNVGIIKTEKGFNYYVNNQLVSEFTNENCDEEEMELLNYIYQTSLEEKDNIPKDYRILPKKKNIVLNNTDNN